ncbi:uncharacterized protein BXZ73DRAFT_87744 [Epithele typhae]|uniref:uncharacterized protein n=1 Tax=Epithele typhae TaxID=378194 RepID=UPI002008D9A6|nr:uncharacterized protein BXZ73DRAFT_87744 [Epithele typhae]KAH9943414.1 hypothetical protein BXZ73DRAFT_87744 [Epithele typhae]
MAKKGGPTLFNPKPSRPVPTKKPAPAVHTPSPGPSQTQSTHSAPGTPRKPGVGQPAAARRPAPLPPSSSTTSAPTTVPEGVPTEYRLMSSKLNGWKYDVMKFDSRKHLNRKDPHRQDAAGAGGAGAGAVTAMVGSDGKHVIGADGKIVMVDAQGRPVRAGDGGGEGKEGDKDKDKKKRFQKKTKQVFKVPEATRQLRREEKFPWVIEDGLGQETWVASMEEVSKSDMYAMFMPAANDIFKFVPAHRWYKFHKKPSHHVPTLEEAESLMSKLQKRKDASQWTLRQKTEQAAASGRHWFTAGSEPRARGRKLRTETFADDEDRMEHDDKEDEETKELEERLKREYKNANKLFDGFDADTDEEEDDDKLTGAGKNLQKTLKKLEKGGGYDESDDEKNPYASSEEEEEEEEAPQVHTGPAILPPEPKPGMRPPAQVPPATPLRPLGRSRQRMEHHWPLPKVPKPKAGIPSRAGSPLASPTGASPPTSRPTSPHGGRGNTTGPDGAPRQKKRKAPPPAGELEDRMVIEWLRSTENATTRECIQHFNRYLTDETKKTRFTALVKEIAQLSNGHLVLRPAYRGAVAAAAA